ncbi:major facilitator superfamily transporter [Mytilinidion resinicola]|uniref:Major facilitator superfamily transporter n=1 Tax=Mytilinidion resinicola TaxID=574789 RepID=A0A6A6YH09_9PEZI|nr:major facilitator superfamily transporter [Mytilinidion resinicola]KAF2807294.1 major facilitator superfamily transporter [Mytilinidion resinicola]
MAESPTTIHVKHTPSEDTINSTEKPSPHNAASTHHDSPSPSGELPTAPSDASLPPQDGSEFPSMAKIIPVMIAIYLTMFLIALDRTIIATAIPRITDDFHSLGNIGWYGSSYLLTLCSFQLVFGRVYTFYDPKWTLLTCIAIFEIGSTVCGAAPSSTAFIVGRAIAGLGAAGMQNGSIIIITRAIPLQKRPIFIGCMGAVFGIASVTGPLLGGVFTEHVSWRWCFYINLPVGAVAVTILVIILQVPPQAGDHDNRGLTFKAQLQKLDPLGTLVLLPGIICLLLALQWGGSTYAWHNARIIVLLILFILLSVAFIAIQIWKGDTATVPPHIFCQRSIVCAFAYIFCCMSAMLIFSFYIPIWFQAIKGVTPTKSGIDVLPMVIALVVASFIAGGFVQKVGYYAPPMILSSIIMPIAAGLLTTWQVNSGHAMWIGYQVLYGLGLGVGMQQATMVAQCVLGRKDVSSGVALMFFAQNLGGAIFVSVGQNVFANQLVKSMSHIAGLDANEVVKTGATNLRHVVKPELLGAVLAGYNIAIRHAFYVGVAMSCMTIFGALGVEWKSIKGKNEGGPTAESAQKTQEKDESV